MKKTPISNTLEASILARAETDAEREEREAALLRKAEKRARRDAKSVVDAPAKPGSATSAHSSPDTHPSWERPLHRRSSLAHQGGEARWVGHERIGPLLAAALTNGAEPADSFTHGFHTYPARMHPAIARTLLEDLWGPASEGVVYDPFCGSGTVLVEALLCGRPSIGSDLNPLALRIAEVKTDLRDQESIQRFMQIARDLAARSEERVRGREPIHVDLPPYELRWFSPHVLKELGGLREEIRAVDDVRDRRAFEIVLSSLLVKLSLQRGETTATETEKRIRKGLPTEMFLRKADELAERWFSLSEAVQTKDRPMLFLEDVLSAGSLFTGERATLTRPSLILSSPPYGGTYDYVDHHARRYAWLDLDARRLRRSEWGARRKFSDPKAAGGSIPEALAEWDKDVVHFLRCMRSIIRHDGLMILVVGDALIGGELVDAAEQLARLAGPAGFRPMAAAAQMRPDFTGKTTSRLEHLVALQPA